MTCNVLVTGGAGYIGSHTVLLLLEKNYRVTVVDNLYNSSIESLRRVEHLTGRSLSFVEADIRDTEVITEVVATGKFDSVIHFAGLKAVTESVERPVDYYDINFGGTVSLLKALEGSTCQQIIFSSSATVYGEPQYLPYTEKHPFNPSSPYGHSKLMVERLLRDAVHAPKGALKAVVLRYFNPVGAHPSGEIGEDPNGVPNNLMPFITQVACGKRDQLKIYGDDYPTSDGTCVRDYIHVMDIAQGHINALNYHGERYNAFNLGTSRGTSVAEMVDVFQDINKVSVPSVIVNRRSGDIAEFYADSMKANEMLDWRATHSLVDMVEDAWRWQQMNPDGYGE